MNRFASALLALTLFTTPACGFVEDLVRDPVGTTLETTWDMIPFADEAVPYVLDGALNAAFNVGVLTLHIIDPEFELEEHPGWICFAACGPGDEGVDFRIGHLSCANCEATEDGVYVASNDVALVVTEGDWRVQEFSENDAGAVAATFDASGDTSWTWTDGTQEITQPVFVRDAIDIAAFDLSAGEEVQRVELAVGETLDLELLPVDAEGHILAANYQDVSFADAIAFAERVSFTSVEGWDNVGTIARITATTPGESSFVVRCAGAERTFEIVVR